MPNTPLCPAPPTQADNEMVLAIRQAHAALRQTLATPGREGDFCFLTERRAEALAAELANIEQLFCEMYGLDAWAQAVRAN